MSNGIKIEEIKSKIPHGGIKEIAKRAGTHYTNVADFFNSKRTPRNANKILRITAEYLQELKNEKEQIKEIFNTL